MKAFFIDKLKATKTATERHDDKRTDMHIIVETIVFFL